MRVSFLKAPTGGIIGLEMITFVEPLGLECVAGGLEEHGHECQIIDIRIDGYDLGMKKLKAFGPDLVGLQCNFTTERFRALRLADRVREELPDVPMLLGGHDASRDPQWFEGRIFEYVAIGDGEEILPAMVDAMERDADLASVPGLMLNRGDGPVYTGHAPARGDIDDLPMPARHLIRDYQDEYYINFRRPLALLETARGCPFACNFCSVWKFHESTFREKSPQRVVAELEQIEAKNIFITDDIFWINRNRAVDLAHAMRDIGERRHLTIQTRSDIIVKFPDLVELWTESADIDIFLGLEKVNDKGLDSVNKSNSVANNDEAIRILQSLNVGYTPNFIVDPDWEIKDFEELKRWIDKTGAYNSGFSVLTPLPGTDLWDDVRSDVNTEDWELFDITHAVLPTRLPLDEFYAQYAGLWSHALDVRYSIKGRMKTHLQLLAALATRKVTFSALKKGMRMGAVLSSPDTFLRAHQQSGDRLSTFAQSSAS